jgi:hypothetical protein
MPISVTIVVASAFNVPDRRRGISSFMSLRYNVATGAYDGSSDGCQK